MSIENAIVVDTILRIIICLGIGLLAGMATYHLLTFIEDRYRMKKNLKRKRDEMVADLLTRVMNDNTDLHNDSLEARKELIRVSFEFNQNQGDESGSSSKSKKR